MNHQGKSIHRLSINPREKIAAELWERDAPNTLPYLLGSDNKRADLTDRDCLVAATVVQWLGSPVGQSFVREMIAAWDKVKP